MKRDRAKMHWTERELGLNPESPLAKALDARVQAAKRRAEDAHSPGDARCNFCDEAMPCHCPTPPDVEKGWKQ